MHRWAATSHRVGPGRRRRWLRITVLLCAGLLVLGVAGRALLPWFVRDFVNRTLDRGQLYSGHIGKVGIHLWRGAYSIHDVRLSKTTGNVPVPFFSAKRADFSVQWNALLHGRLVARFSMEQPEINFVDALESGESQSGSDGAWLATIRDLFPFTINSATVHNGSVHLRVPQAGGLSDVYISHLEIAIDNLGNIRDDTTPLAATVQASARVMDQARWEFKMTLDPFAYRPTFHLAMRLLGLDVTTINEVVLAYGKFDFERGWFDFVLEVDAKEGQLSGYAKTLFRELRVFDLAKDIRHTNPLQFVWQAMVGGTTGLFKNRPRDQFGTLIPFTGDLSGNTSADILATLVNVLRNAFLRAYLPQLERPSQSTDEIQFAPPEFSEILFMEEPS